MCQVLDPRRVAPERQRAHRTLDRSLILRIALTCWDWPRPDPVELNGLQHAEARPGACSKLVQQLVQQRCATSAVHVPSSNMPAVRSVPTQF